MSALQVVAPTDAQLRTIREMCEERGLEPPAVVASKQEAMDIFDRIKARTYDPADFAYPYGWEQDVPF